MERMYVNCPKVFGTEETLSESRPQAPPPSYIGHTYQAVPLRPSGPSFWQGCAVASVLGAGF